MSWEVWDPLNDMKAIQKEMENAFKNAFRRSTNRRELTREPLTDVSETDKDVVAKIELPGVDKKDIDLKVTENMLAVRAKKKKEKKQEKEGFYRHERSYQSFQRAFSLPAKVKSDKAEAEFKDGLLKVTVPKVKPAKKEKEKKAKKVKIK